MIQIRKANLDDVKQIREIMVGFGLPASIFITSSEDRIAELIHQSNSYVCLENGFMVGFLLVEDGDYIDTICSTRNGVGKALLKNLPSGRYEVNISDQNEKSRRLFGSLGFTFMRKEIVEGQERGRYEGYIGQGRTC